MTLLPREEELLEDVEQLYREGVLVYRPIDCGHDDWWLTEHRPICRICHPPAVPTLPKF